MTKVAELYGFPTFQEADWLAVATNQQCPFLGRKCLKNRKSEPDLTIGTCTMTYGRTANPVMICPFRLLERSQIFTDCLHLLTLHEPGNELRIIPELNVPGGSIDYCLVSVRDGKPKDFVGIELQTLDSTGTVWPERQRFLQPHGIPVDDESVVSRKRFGMNWKMTSKTVLVQLHHKITTFEHLRKHLVLVLQDCLLEYMRREFNFGHISGVRDGDSMQFHAYDPAKADRRYIYYAFRSPPELHVHPKLQAELGDLFIDAAKSHGQQCLIETHSEHLILRLLRRIRESTAGNAHRGILIDCDDVAVYYAAAVNGQTTLRRIEIDSKGEFIQPWPDDFFEIDFHERFG